MLRSGSTKRMRCWIVYGILTLAGGCNHHRSQDEVPTEVSTPECPELPQEGTLIYEGESYLIYGIGIPPRPELGEAEGTGDTIPFELDHPCDPETTRRIAATVGRRRGCEFVRERGACDGTPLLQIGSELSLMDIGPVFSGIYRTVGVRHTFSFEGVA